MPRKVRQKTLRDVIDPSSSLLHLGRRIDFFRLAGMPSTGEPLSIQAYGAHVRVRWVES